MTTFINKDKLFLDEESFKSMVPSSRNVSDTQTIYYSIALSQTQQVKEIMGRDFYYDMVNSYTDFIDSGITMGIHYEYLMDNFLKPILAFTTYKRLINNLSFKLKEGGLRSNIETNTELAQPQDRGYIISEITRDIDTFIADMKHYIYDNRIYFPLYKGQLENDNRNDVNFGIGKVSNTKRNIYSGANQPVYQSKDQNNWF